MEEIRSCKVCKCETVHEMTIIWEAIAKHNTYQDWRRVCRACGEITKEERKIENKNVQVLDG